jgi:hypothetical protein
MNEADHLSSIEDLKRSREVLKSDDKVLHVRLYAEASFKIACDLVSGGCQRKEGVHSDNHQGMSRWLREHGYTAQAEFLVEMENMRTGRWYGKKGNGEAIRRCDEICEALEGWALA